MDRFIQVDKSNINDIIAKYNVICCKLRNSRIKAKQLGILEMIMMNYDLNLLFVKNGPLGDVKGIVSFLIEKENYNKLVNRFEHVGYFNKFYTLDFESKENDNNSDIKTINALNWKGLDYSLQTTYIQSDKLYEEQSPHNRVFKILSKDGEIKTIKGYRGNGKELGRRALPVEDCICLVNLSMPYLQKKVLEPFAGGGGIVYMYKQINPNIDITSIDIDKTLEPGLKYYGAKHIVGDSATVDLIDLYDAIVTEVPFSLNVTKHVTKVFKNIYNNLKEKGILVLMCDLNQSEEIMKYLSDELSSNLLFLKKLNRKGNDVVIQIWTKNNTLKEEIEDTIETISKIF